VMDVLVLGREGAPQATVVGGSLRASPLLAALANGAQSRAVDQRVGLRAFA